MERASRWTAAAFQSAVAGRADHALDCLEHAQSQRFATFPLLLQAPSLRSLRGHPRFRAILRGLRLEERVWFGREMPTEMRLPRATLNRLGATFSYYLLKLGCGLNSIAQTRGVDKSLPNTRCEMRIGEGYVDA